jgi:hypothetical protein
MKKSMTVWFVIVAAITAHAQQVALHGASGAQLFTGTAAFVNAYNAATAGDTLYLPGGGFTSPTTIDKSLLIFGAGHYPDSTAATAKTISIGTITLGENADGLRMEGIDINGNLQTGTNQAVDNVIIRYCKMNILNIQGNMSNPSKNLTVINTILAGDVLLTNAQNAGIFSCIIQGRVRDSYANLLENNILMFSYSGTSILYTIHGDNNISNNNIFLNASGRCFIGISNQAYNNLSVGTPNWGTTPIGSGNYYPVAQSAIFVDQTGNAFNYAHDYHLQSPGTYLGVDGKEVGLYGGTHGYKEGAVPSNPHIQFQDIAPTTDENGFLNIRIKAAAQDY